MVAEATAATAPARAKRRAGLSRGMLATLSVAGGLLLWEIVARLLIKNPLFLAAPSETMVALGAIIRSGELGLHVWISAIEFLIGFGIAVVAGIAIGLAMASSRRTQAILNPWVSAFYATPIIALAPLIILWSGVGIWSKVIVVISLVVFPVIINTETGIRQTDRQLIEMVRCFGANRAQIFFKVSLPSALPFILAGVRLGVGRGLIGVVVGELFGARAGLGYMIAQSAEVFDMPKMFAGVVVLAAAGIGLTAAFHALERRLVPWNNSP